LKTTYYLRSRPATKIAQTNAADTGSLVAPAPTEAKKEYTEAEALACSLENPEMCDACQ
jgi:ribonucleoside-diphosphate reductase alpha chain